MQDYIAMVLIWLATEQPVSAVSNEDYKEISEKLKNLQKIIEESLIIKKSRSKMNRDYSEKVPENHQPKG